jgi:hypothetical protein
MTNGLTLEPGSNVSVAARFRKASALMSPRAHGGRTWVENRPEGGAIFSLVIPLKAACNERTERIEP